MLECEKLEGVVRGAAFSNQHSAQLKQIDAKQLKAKG
jgi:hypothetical protein